MFKAHFINNKYADLTTRVQIPNKTHMVFKFGVMPKSQKKKKKYRSFKILLTFGHTYLIISFTLISVEKPLKDPKLKLKNKNN